MVIEVYPLGGEFWSRLDSEDNQREYSNQHERIRRFISPIGKEVFDLYLNQIHFVESNTNRFHPSFQLIDIVQWHLLLLWHSLLLLVVAILRDRSVQRFVSEEQRWLRSNENLDLTCTSDALECLSLSDDIPSLLPVSLPFSPGCRHVSKAHLRCCASPHRRNLAESNGLYVIEDFSSLLARTDQRLMIAGDQPVDEYLPFLTEIEAFAQCIEHIRHFFHRVPKP